MKIKKINTGILITKTAKQPSAKIEFSLDELDSLSEFCERLQDEKDIREYLTTAVTIPDSAEVSAPIAAKYLHDAALFEQLVVFIYNCIVNETAALEWFRGDFLQLYLKYKKMYSGIVAQNLQLYRKYEILVCKGIYNYIVNKEKFTVQIVFV